MFLSVDGTKGGEMRNIELLVDLTQELVENYEQGNISEEDFMSDLKFFLKQIKVKNIIHRHTMEHRHLENVQIKKAIAKDNGWDLIGKHGIRCINGNKIKPLTVAVREYVESILDEEPVWTVQKLRSLFTEKEIVLINEYNQMIDKIRSERKENA